MKKRALIISVALSVAIVAALGVNFKSNNSELSALAQANIEALAAGESSTGVSANCSSAITKCTVKCSSCGATYEALVSGKATNVEGKCECGKSF